MMCIFLSGSVVNDFLGRFFKPDIDHIDGKLLRVPGAANVFDSFVNIIGPPNSNRLSVGLPYARRTPTNYEGGSWYLRGTFTW
jgi:hypothetical protein